MVLVVPLLAVSSSGESTRLGSSAATAGRNGVATIAVMAASVKTMAGGASFQMRTALTAMIEPRVTSHADHDHLARVAVGERRRERAGDRHEGQAHGAEDAHAATPPTP